MAFLLGNDYDAVSASVGLVAILLLMFLLVEKEALRARGAPMRVVSAFDVAIVPLLLATGIVLSLRLIALLG